ncbi:MAG: hypothetical protein PHQ90_00025 [Sulfuricurvum sp.]|nr:hypothetical protein [Sulfuricurvum sp.]
MSDVKCVFCGNDAKEHGFEPQYDGITYTCSVCGRYVLERSFRIERYSEQKDKFYKVSSWIRENNDLFDKAPKITTKDFPKLLDIHDKKVKVKFDMMMQCIYMDRSGINDTNKYIVQCWFKDLNEFLLFFQKAIDDGFVKAEIQRFLDHTCRVQFQNLTFDGLQYIENLESPNKSSKNVFLAFNFETELNDIFSTYVRKAVEESGLNCIIVNQNNTEHDKSITDEIIGKLKSSRIVIADFTNHRNSVYFEAGFAMGMKIPIIWTVQKGHDDAMSFDTRQYPHIVWENGEDLKKQIMDRIRVII